MARRSAARRGDPSRTSSLPKRHQRNVTTALLPAPTCYAATPRHSQTTSPPPRSRVVIWLAENTKAKPDANTRTLRPDKCLVVSSLTPALRPVTHAILGSMPSPPGLSTRAQPLALFGRLLPRIWTCTSFLDERETPRLCRGGSQCLTVPGISREAPSILLDCESRT